MDAVSDFYSIDTTTGALTTIGPAGVALVGYGNSVADDLVGISSSSLFEISPNGSATFLASFPGTPTGGLAVFGFDAYWTETNGELWGSRAGNPGGGPGLIGNTGQNDLDALVFAFDPLAVGLELNPTLYAFASNGQIFTLTGTGAAIDTGVTTISGITGAAFLNLPEPAAVFLVSAGLLIMAGLHRAITCQRRT